MEITIRIYTKNNNYPETRSISLNEQDLDDMISNHLHRERYLKDGEVITSITYEEIKL